METLKARKAWTGVLQTIRDHRCLLRLLYPEKLSNTVDGEKKTSQGKTKSKQYLSKSSALQ